MNLLTTLTNRLEQEFPFDIDGAIDLVDELRTKQKGTGRRTKTNISSYKIL